MALMFSSTANIQKAVALINDLDSSKFPLILTRILQKLHLKDERTFSDAEEEKLQSALSVSDQSLQLIIETCEFFLHQAAYHTAKPAVLSQQLQKLDLHEDKVSAIVEAWSGAAKGVVEKLRGHSLVNKQLEGVNWALHLEMGHTDQAKLKSPSAALQLNIQDQTTQETEKVQMEFTHKELYQFYNQLEAIQGQLDSLS